MAKWLNTIGLGAFLAAGVAVAGGEGQFAGRLACYSDLESFSRSSGHSQFLEFEKAPSTFGSYLQSIAGDRTGRILVRAALRGPRRGFYIVHDTSFFFQELPDKPRPGESVHHYFEFSLNGMAKRQPIYVDYMDGLSRSGDENTFRLITVDDSRPITFKDQDVRRISPPEGLSPQAEAEFNEDLERKIQTVSGEFGRDRAERERLRQAGEEVGRHIKTRDQFIAALAKCRSRLKGRGYEGLVRAIDAAAAQIEGGSEAGQESAPSAIGAASGK